MALCTTCHEALSLDNVGSFHELAIPHHSSISAFLAAVSQRCHLCWSAHRHLQPHIKSKFDELASQEASRSVTSQGSSCLSSARKADKVTRIIWKKEYSILNGPQYLNLNLELDGIPGRTPIGYKSLFFMPTIGMSQASVSYRSIFTSLISRRCKEVPPADEPLFQYQLTSVSRHGYGLAGPILLDISGESGQIRLVSGTQVSSTESYITLSYRWGTRMDIMLTQQNQADLRLGLSVQKLSRTFQDTILVARQIGVRFLWIDRLCIIQDGDDGRDWAAESIRMGLIYQHGYCNISADSASDTQGLFFDRDLDFFRQVRISTRDVGGSITEWTSIDRDMWATEVNNSVLNSRGWVFQERLLASRVIHFCRQEIFWECRQRFCCESFPESLPSAEVLDLSQTASLRQLPTELAKDSPWAGIMDFPIEDLPYDGWDDVVKAYTKCQFTYPQDKLVAIAGVARHMKSSIKDIYLAGMWKKRLSAELAWWVYPDRDRYTYGQEPSYYAPSFSWASVKGQINSSGPFALGILVEVDCVTMDSGQHNGRRDKPILEDVFGVALKSPMFQLKVIGKLRSFKLHKKEVWKAIMPVSTYAAKQSALTTSIVELDAWLDFAIPDSESSYFERVKINFDV
ncbi:Ff.00g066840.m01.CDS01 [Fusarium sp. VM40]|nr:Ff.00g066840.m01.CDS01 [Fusarium sp. VM40]